MQSSSCSILKHIWQCSEARVGRLLVENLSHSEHRRTKGHEKMPQTFCLLCQAHSNCSVQIVLTPPFTSALLTWERHCQSPMGAHQGSVRTEPEPIPPLSQDQGNGTGQPQPQALSTSLGRFWGPGTWTGCGEPQGWAGTCRTGRTSVPQQ